MVAEQNSQALKLAPDTPPCAPPGVEATVNSEILRKCSVFVGMTNLLELLNGTLVNSTALVDQFCSPCKRGCDRKVGGVGHLTAGGGRLSGVDVADNDHVDMRLLLTADGQSLTRCDGGGVVKRTP